MRDFDRLHPEFASKLSEVWPFLAQRIWTVAEKEKAKIPGVKLLIENTNRQLTPKGNRLKKYYQKL